MGALLGGAIGLAGSLFGGSSKKSSANTAAGQSLAGFNYLTQGPGAKTITNAQTAGANATDAQAGTQNAEAELLGTKPITDQTRNGFTNYLGSTGFNFQKQQGESAITGSAAARGVLNSGSTAKALTKYGQGIGANYFNSYLDQLSGLNTQQGNTAGQGITASQIVGQAGTTGGGNAANATLKGGDAMGDAITTGAGILGRGVAGAYDNYFGSV